MKKTMTLIQKYALCLGVFYLILYLPACAVKPASDLDNPEYHHKAGMRHVETRQYEEALTSFQRAVKLDKKFASAYAGMGIAHANLKNKKEAKNTQEAHGAITPVDISLTPEHTNNMLNTDEHKLYTLIWQRTIASQMKDALFERTTVEFRPSNDQDLAVFMFSDQELVFPGYLKATNEQVTDNPPPDIQENDTVELKGIKTEQHFTDPPPRYNDASMIKALEEKGIGRPSTYAEILSKLTEREYVVLKQKRYQPSDMGRLVSNFLNTSFSEYVNDEFTSKMEDNLDAISSGTKTKTEVLDQFWQPLIEGIDKVSATVTRKDVNPQRPLGQHPESEKPMFARMTKNGPAVQIGDIDADDKLEWASLKEGQSLFAITLEDACALFEKQEDNVLGHHPESGEPIIARVARYGPTIQLGTKDNGNKPRYIGVLPSENLEDLTLDRALEYLSLPKELGKDPESGESILVTIGPYGPYLKRGGKNFRARKGADPFAMDLDEALASIGNNKGSGAIKTFDDSPVKIVDGRWGPYITNGKKNASVPKDKTPEDMELSECLELLDKAPAKKRRAKKSKASKN